MSIHNKGLQKTHFDSVVNGTKTVEGRLYKDNIRSIRVDDLIVFSNGEKDVTVRVTEIFLYSTFYEMVLNHHRDLLPDEEDFEQALKVYNDIYPDKEKEITFGTAAIKFELI